MLQKAANLETAPASKKYVREEIGNFLKQGFVS